MELLKQLCRIHAPSGNEGKLTQFLLDYIDSNKASWRVMPQVLAGEGFQDCIILVFGQPRTAIFAHIDSIGFTVRYGRELIKVGGPDTETGYRLVGEDRQGPIACTLQVSDEYNGLSYEFERDIDRGTELVFACNFRETETTVQSCYLDNRLGVWSALQVAKTLENGAIVFSCWEEHRGGSVAYLAKYLHEKYGVKQALISDITWVTEGVHPGKGVVISLRDSLIPRRSFVNKLIDLAQQTNIPFQLEVEGVGGSDAKELQQSAIPWDWCFVGAPEDNVHSPDEIVHKADIQSMVALYEVLMREL
ncbi:aminopeptidase [Adhaeribacter arboris]|uniref:Aminopeptidase n=1 Tax=Adhaeribacter arboris TaxID=2072846 RepID=A0A2T2Y967_9BACT|nr:M20/M25/M40 family metallo-hydrolase [Adhaeribacter arboris]PSR52071.1 aminopeptidase [Adhaeribacter arboris]